MNQSLFQQAIKAHQEGDFTHAERDYLALLKEDPKNADYLHLIGILYGQNANPEAGLSYVQDAIKQQPNTSTFYNTLGNLYRQLLNTDKAKEAYARSIELDPTSATAHNNLGNMYFREKNLADAKKQYEKAIALNPDYAEPHFNLAMVLLQLNEQNNAAEHLHTTLQYDSQHFEAHRQLGLILFQHGDFEKAIEHFSHSAKIDHSNPETYVNWGAALSKLDRDQEAVKTFLKALEIQPDHYEANFNTGAIYLNLHKPKHALEHFLKILDKHPNPEVYYNVGVIYMYQDHHGEAIGYLKEVLKLDPNHIATRLNLGVIYIKTENYADAIEQYEAALRIEPDNQEIQYTLAALTQADSPLEAPAEYIQHLFDQYAPYFDKHLKDYLKYETPERLYEAVYDQLNHQQDLVIVDIGCGTGLCGEKFKPLAKQLIGIDLSAEMLKQAEEKNIYDQLIESDINPALANLSDIDLIIAGDVFTYIGDLNDTFKHCHDALKQGGLFAFTTEKPPTEDGDYQLQKSARFCHHPLYIQRLAQEHSLTILSQQEITLRHQKNQPLSGYLFILQG